MTKEKEEQKVATKATTGIAVAAIDVATFNTMMASW
jgi:hypothetical protein